MTSFTPRTPSTPHQMLGDTTRSVPAEVAHLFRTKRVSEIRQYESQIRVEAEEKGDSLRDLLGTRYSDLLRAADEMTAMHKASSKSLRDALQTVSKSASSLHDQFNAQASRITPAQSTDDLARRKDVHMIGSKLKHIVDSPEVLYALLEGGQIFEAAARFSRADVYYHALLSNMPRLEGAANQFAETRWAQVSAFKGRILSAAERQLVTPGLKNDAYAHGVASLILLTPDCDVVNVLKGMLASRTGWIDDDSRQSDGSVRVRVTRVAEVVRDTISSISYMFWNKESGIDVLLRDVSESAVRNVETVRDDGALQRECVAWTESVKQWLEDDSNQILRRTTSSRELADTLRDLDEVFSPDCCKSDCRASLGHSVDFVIDIFKPLISKRAGIVARESVEGAVSRVTGDVQTIWSEATGTGAIDVGKKMWLTISSQAVGLSSQAGNQLESTNPGEFEWMQKRNTPEEEEREIARVLASSGRVGDVLTTFDDVLREAVADVKVVTQRVPSVSAAFSESVGSLLPRVVDDLRERVQNISMIENDLSSGKEPMNERRRDMELALFAARLASGIGGAPCVKAALCFEKSSNTIGGGKSYNAALQDFRKAADEVVGLSYCTWAKLLSKQAGSHLADELTMHRCLDVDMGWSAEPNDAKLEVVENAKSEDDAAAHLPTSASAPLVGMLLTACQAANCAGGFALPYVATEYLRKELAIACVQAYSRAADWYGNSSEKAVMQLLFDVLAIQELLMSSTDDGDDEGTMETLALQKSTAKDLEKVHQRLQSFIDPIDLAYYRLRIQKAATVYVSKSCVLFGALARTRRGSLPVRMQPTGTISLSSSSNFVSLAPSVARFAYLPAPMPSTYTTPAAATAGLNARAAVNLLRSQTTTNASATNSYRKTETDTSVAGYASKVSESMGRLGFGFLESLTRKVA